MHSLPSLFAARRLAGPALVLVLVAACGTTAPASPTAPVSQTPVSPTPGTASPSPSAGATYWLRMTTTQAIPPIDLFGVGPAAIIDGNGRFVVPGVVPAIFPGPLVIPLFARQVSEEGRAKILGWAKDLGLLAGPTDFTAGGGLPGGVLGHIELTVDGHLVTLTGFPDIAAPNPDPGSPQAFAELWRRISSLPDTLRGEVGPEVPYAPAAYAILVGPAPKQQDGMAGAIVDWPLDGGFATFGASVANGTRRCGLVEGADAATLAPVVAKANQLTQWVQDPTTSATFGLTVRPIVAGENPCKEAFGG
jgi:hypothetical protein